ncbi:MAG TPA: M15 family metallopeptidase [Nocardioidaceae bacterium]|nr:M15 family metallopeptidase [Nocardioidaceae bacterium]
MAVRRTRSESLPARGIAVGAVLLLLSPLAACRDETTASPRATAKELASSAPSGNSSAGVPSSPSVPSGAGSPTPAETPGQGATDPAPGGSTSKKPKVLQGGGFASAVPGSDAPDRKVDVGPQYAVSEGLDIKEVERLVKAVEKIAKEQRVGQPLATVGSVAGAVGTFSYRWFADGSVQPDPSWVAANIRTEAVPILGNVTGHKVLFPQLRGALNEVVARGLADQIDPSQFGGCYVPRFIAHDPSKGLSLHTWGIAVDLNVPGNQRGTFGQMNRDVVAIFKKWGFAWGGDWSYTDPMHFELNRIVRAR